MSDAGGAAGGGGGGGGGGFPDKYGADLETIRDFLEHFESEDKRRKYMELMQEVASRRVKVVDVDLGDLAVFGVKGEDLLANVEGNVLRYLDLFYKAFDSILETEFELQYDRSDPVDILQYSRKMNQERARDQSAGVGPGGEMSTMRPVEPLPHLLTRRYEIRFLRHGKAKSCSVRDVRAKDIGHLMSIRGQVVRVTDVRPKVTVATYVCDSCQGEVFQEVRSRQYLPLFDCPDCEKQGKRNTLFPQTRGSRFIKFQELKIQELTEDVPMGAIPRTMTVYLYGELTRSCAPGEIVTITGVYLPIPATGFKALRQGLVTDTYFEAMHVHKAKQSYGEILASEEIDEKIDNFIDAGDVYERLARSIAPEIFGHEDVKKALLLLLVGGVTKVMGDGMRIRGDINICLMGDPGVAKSQMLRQVARITPRGVYTTGKGSSGVGLTAAVLRDPTTSELVLEGGSLVLADKGICCIDEFDKMDEGDRTAIHEVMEQQTVSIAKAGITTTLNARTAILAAANPAYGRYDPRRSTSENINMPAALLSRFDMLYVMMDRPNHDADTALARFVTHVHRTEGAPVPESTGPDADADVLRGYIARAKDYDPVVTKVAGEYLCNEFVRLRQADAEGGSSVVTARALLSVVRMSQALARLRFSESVDIDDVDEALRLLNRSRSSIVDDDVMHHIGTDTISSIYNLIRDLAVQMDSSEISLSDLEPRVFGAGFKRSDLETTLDEYQALNVWQFDGDSVRFVF